MTNYEDKEKTAVQIIEEVCGKICDDYCRWNHDFMVYGLGRKEAEEELEKRCDGCPLMRLL